MNYILYMLALLTVVYGARAESPSINLMALIGGAAIYGAAEWYRISRRRITRSLAQQHPAKPEPVNTPAEADSLA